MERRKFTREFARFGCARHCTCNWVKAFSDDPAYAFRAAEQVEIARLKREVIKFKAERDILNKPRPTSRRNRREVRLHREAPGVWPAD